MRSHEGALVLLLCAGGLIAQREPCTGTVVDADGAALAGATVTFVEDPWCTFGADPDRVTVKSAVDGSFAAGLLRGGFYVVWAIGPVREDGAHAVCTAQPIGAAGATLRLCAGRVMQPHKVALRGVDAWRRHLAPALRVLVGGVPFGHDRPLSGDCELLLGPWPGPVTLQLVDPGLRVVAQRERLDDSDLTVEFGEPVPLVVEVRDAAGRAVENAAISTMDPLQQEPVPGLLPGPTCKTATVAASTDRQGRATLLVEKHTAEGWEPPRVLWVFAAAQSRGSAFGIAGLENGLRVEVQRDGAPPPLALTLARQHEVRWQLRLPPQETLRGFAVDCSGPGNGGGTIGLRLPSRVVSPEELAFLLPDALASLTPRLRLGGDGIVLLDPVTEIDPEQPFRLDATGLRRTSLLLVDAEGRPVPRAQVGFAFEASDMFAGFHERGVTDGNGELIVRHGAAKVRVVVVSERGFALAPLQADAEQRVVLTPLRQVELFAVDNASRPLAGAWVVNAQPRGRRDDVLWWWAQTHWLQARHADHEGRVRVPLFEGGVTVQLARGPLRSETLELVDERTRYVRLR